MGVKDIGKDFLYYASLGHKVESVDPKAYSALLGFRKNVSLISVEKVQESLSLVNNFLKTVLKKEEPSILFLNLNEDSSISTKIAALKSLQPFLVRNWSSGMLTNIVAKSKIDMIFVLSAKNHNFVLQEAKKLNIPVLSIIDSDTNSNLVTFPIWANDDSLELHHFITSMISLVMIEAQLMKYGVSCS
jgi:small subunit ribosomal protein S2